MCVNHIVCSFHFPSLCALFLVSYRRLALASGTAVHGVSLVFCLTALAFVEPCLQCVAHLLDYPHPLTFSYLFPSFPFLDDDSHVQQPAKLHEPRGRIGER